MAEGELIKHFGTVAMDRGFITKDQFIDAMAIQIENDLDGIETKSFGETLKSVRYMTDEQITEVIRAMGTPS